MATQAATAQSATALASILSHSEKKRLKELEETIRGSLSSYLTVGRALEEIRSKKLHRESHNTFEDYAKERFGISLAHAKRLMDAADVADDMAPNGSYLDNERQARELAPFSSEFRQAMAKKIEAEVKTPLNGRMSALELREKTYQLGREMFNSLRPEDKLAVAKLAQKRTMARAEQVGRERIKEDCLGHLEKAMKCLKRLNSQDALELCQTLVESVEAL